MENKLKEKFEAILSTQKTVPNIQEISEMMQQAYELGKQEAGTPAIATTEEKGETQPDTELIKFVLNNVANDIGSIQDHLTSNLQKEIRAMLPAITEAWGKEKGK